jgi:hypothetical protein
MRVYTQIREMLATNQELIQRMDELGQTVVGHDERIDRVFNYLYQLIEKSATAAIPRKRVGYK